MFALAGLILAGCGSSGNNTTSSVGGSGTADTTTTGGSSSTIVIGATSGTTTTGGTSSNTTTGGTVTPIIAGVGSATGGATVLTGPTNEFVYTANSDGHLDGANLAFSIFPVVNGTITNSSTQTGENGYAELISVVTGQPVALAIEIGYQNVTTYNVNSTNGDLTFLSDQTSAVTSAFVNRDQNDQNVVDWAAQYNFGTQTVSYIEEDSTASLGAFTTQETSNATSPEGTLVAQNFSQQISTYFVDQSQRVNVAGYNFLLTFEGDAGSEGDATAAVESWNLNSNGTFVVNQEAPTTTLRSLFGGASDVNGASVPVNIGGTTYVVATTNGVASNNESNVFVLSVSSSGVVSPVVNGTAATDATGQTIPTGVAVVPVSTTVAASGYEAVVAHYSGNLTTYPINTDGSLGTGVVSPTQVPVGYPDLAALIPSSTIPNLFFAVVGEDFANSDDDALVPIMTDPVSGNITVGPTVDTGAIGAVDGSEVDGGDAAFAQKLHARRKLKRGQ